MQTLLLILIAVLSLSIILLGVFCWKLGRFCNHLQGQLRLIVKEDSNFVFWAKSKILKYRDNCCKQSGNSGSDACSKCPIFD